MQRRWIILGSLLGLGIVVTGISLALKSARPTPISMSTVPTSEPILNPIVMISGRDDHGLPAEPMVRLLRAPDPQLLNDEQAVTAQVHSGDFGRVVEARGEWLRVEMIADPQVSGWISDYYLRNRAFRFDQDRVQLEFVDAQLRDEQVWVAVRPVLSPTATPVWVPASSLFEVGLS